MAAGYAHYLFGELRQVNESRVFPDAASSLKAWLDIWLPQWVQSAEEAEPNFEQVRDLCRDWQTGDWREDVGLISLPLRDVPKLDGVHYVHLICRVYFNWASGGRVSRTGHAVVLTEAQWQALAFDPFRLPHLVENAAEFASSQLLNFKRFETEADEASVKRGADDVQRLEPWPSDLATIWQGRLPGRLPVKAPPRLYRRLLLRLEPSQRKTTSCVCGPFGLKRSFQPLIDIAPGSELSVSDAGPANGGACDGYWDVNWTREPLGIPGPVARVDETPTPALGAPVGVAPSPVQDSVPRRPITLGNPGQRKDTKVGLWLGIGAVLLLGAGLYWGPGLWGAWWLGKDCDAWTLDLNDSAKQLSDTRALLARAEVLLGQDPDGQVCKDLRPQIRTLTDLYRSRLGEIEGPRAEFNVQKINRLNADLQALGALPRVLDTDDGKARYETLVKASDTLYQLAADWVKSAGPTQDLRVRYESVRKDETAQGLAPNPYLTDIAAEVRTREQQEALDALRVAATRVGPLDRAGLDAVSKLSEGFRARYAIERGDELAGILGEAAMQYEKGAWPPLQAAFEALKQRPAADTLAALEAAVAAYQRDLAPASALAPRVGIDTEALLGNLRTDKIVQVSVMPLRVGERAKVGRLTGPGQCEPQEDFAPFPAEAVCVRVFLMPPSTPWPPTWPDEPGQREPVETDSPGWLKPLSDFFDRFFRWRPGGNLPGDVYLVSPQDLLSGTWRSPDGRITLRAKIEWPSLDKFRR